VNVTRTQLLIGSVLFLSLAANAVLGAMAIGHRLAPEAAGSSRPLKDMIQRLAALPPEQRAQTREAVRSYLPRLRDAMEDLRKARQDTFSYVRSPDYTRVEAEKRFAALREKTTALQALGQSMVLDIADHLTPEQRDQLLSPRGQR